MAFVSNEHLSIASSEVVKGICCHGKLAQLSFKIAASDQQPVANEADHCASLKKRLRVAVAPGTWRNDAGLALNELRRRATNRFFTPTSSAVDGSLSNAFL